MAIATSPSDVSVLGLGSMGGALAHWLLERGHRVTVWNRSADRSAALLRRGARLAASPQDALTASPLSFAVVDSGATVETWLDGVAESSGGTLVNVTTTTPSEADRLSRRLRGRGDAFVDAAFFFYPESIGDMHSAARFSGSRTAFDEHRAVFDSLGGDMRFLEGTPGLASVVDAAWITFYVPALTAFLESIAFMTSHDLPYAAARDTLFTAIPVLTGFLNGVTTLQTGDFASPNPVDLYVDSLKTATAPIRDRGLPVAMSNAAVGLLESLPEDDRRTADISILIHNLSTAVHRRTPRPAS